MRIAIDFRIGQNGRKGIAVYARDLVRALLRWHPEHEYVLLVSPRREVPLDDLNEQAELYAVPGYEQHVRRDTFEQISLPAVLERLRIDIYHSPNYILPCIRRLPCPSIVTVHDASMFAFPHLFRGLAGRRFSWLIRRSVQCADVVVADSDFTKTEIGRYLGSEAHAKTRTVYAALPSDLDAVDLQLTKTQLHVEDGFVLGVGLNAGRKNLDRLIDAIKMADSDECRGVLVGELKWSSRHTQQLADALVRKGRLLLPGRVDTPTLGALYRAAGTVVVPSLYEGFGFPLLEAFQFRAPVCAAAIPVFFEIAGDAFRPFDPMDPGAIAGTILEVLRSPAEQSRLVEAGQHRLKRFSWEGTASEYVVEYERAVAMSAA